MNRITSRGVPGYLDIKGISIATNTVTVNSSVADRKWEYFRKELAAVNTNSAVWTNITVSATEQSSVSGNQFLAMTPESYAYDADGNTLSDGRWNYTWDAENRLVNMTSLTNGPSGSKFKLVFVYDCWGRRIQKTVSTSSTGTNYVAQYTNRLVYDAWNLVAQLDNSNHPEKTYLWGNDLSGPLQLAGGVGGLLVENLKLNTSNCVAFVAYDGNGNVIELTGNSGASLGQYEYGPFGEIIRATGLAVKSNPFSFSTKFEDDESGLFYYGFRFYNPSAGRWINRDPMGEQASLNRYGFVNNRPVDRVDVLGLEVMLSTKPAPSPSLPSWRNTLQPATPDEPSPGPGPSSGWGSPALLNPVGIGAGFFFASTANAGSTVPDDVLLLDGAKRRDNREKCKKHDLDDCLDSCDEKGLVGQALKDCYCKCWKDFPKTPRNKSAEDLRNEYYQDTGIPWPNRPGTTIPQIAHHIWSLADGGQDDGSNIEPMNPQDHLDHHLDNGDYSRWGRRKGRTCEEIQ